MSSEDHTLTIAKCPIEQVFNDDLASLTNGTDTRKHPVKINFRLAKVKQNGQ